MVNDPEGPIQPARHVPARSLSDHLVNVMKAVLSSAPFCGGIASLMNDYIPSRRVERIEAFARDVASSLNKVQGRIEDARILTDEYAHLFERCFKGAADFPQQEKIEAFRGILVNSLVPSDLSEDQKEFFLSLVERLSPIHLRVIRFMGDPRGYLAAMGISEDRIRGGFRSFFPIAIPGVTLEVSAAAFADLHRLGFTNTPADIFHTTTAGQGLELLGDRLTPLAKQFVDFCQAPD